MIYIQYEAFNYYKNVEQIHAESLDVFMNDRILCDDRKNPLHLEEQVNSVCTSLANLISILAEKGILNIEDIFKICDCSGKKSAKLCTYDEALEIWSNNK